MLSARMTILPSCEQPTTYKIRMQVLHAAGAADARKLIYVISLKYHGCDHTTCQGCRTPEQGRWRL